jgi:carbon starvation protein
MNAPAGVIRDSVQNASQVVGSWGYQISPEDLAAAARNVEEASLLSRTGGAPTLAVGISDIFSQITGDSLCAFWYHFAIMFEALFILTALDAGTRVGRFMLQDTLGNVYKPFKNVSWKPGLVITSGIVCGLWGCFLWVGVHEPLGGINQLFPIFGISSQLLAAVALAVCTTLLVKSGRLKWAWVTGIPLAWDATVTLTASWQKVFSSDPRVGFFKKRSVYQDAIDRGEVLAPAKNMDDMRTVVTNSTVDGVLSAVLALLIVIVDAARVCIRHVRRPALSTLSEAPYVESKIVAPAGLIPTREEKEEERDAVGAAPGS